MLKYAYNIIIFRCSSLIVLIFGINFLIDFASLLIFGLFYFHVIYSCLSCTFLAVQNVKAQLSSASVPINMIFYLHRSRKINRYFSLDYLTEDPYSLSPSIKWREFVLPHSVKNNFVCACTRACVMRVISMRPVLHGHLFVQQRRRQL